MYIGAPVKRREDERLLRGRGRFVHDIDGPPGTVFAAFLRSPHAHAKIVRIDPSKALAAPGVLGVYTGQDFAGWMKPIRCNTGAATPPIERPVVAVGEARYVGESVAVVVAESRALADDALELVEVDYDALSPVVGIAEVLAGGAAAVHPQFADNIVFRGRAASEGIDAAFENADCVLSDSFHSSRLAGVPMECRGFLADFDQGRELLTLHCPTQMPHRLRSYLAEVMGLRETQVRVVAPDVGGSFGVKAFPYPEDMAGSALSRALGRPVKWVQTRRDDFISTNQARDYRFDVAIAFGKDGAIRGLRAKYFVNAGAYPASPVTSGVEAGGSGTFMVGPYRLPQYAYEAFSLATNTIPTAPVRGVSAPICAFATESLLDRAARRLGISPVEIRRRNLITRADLPYRNAIGVILDTASHLDCLDKALELSGYQEFKETRSGRRGADGRFRGIGVACIADHTGMGSSRFRARGQASSKVPGFDSATIRMEPDAKVTVHVSITTQGQGHHTAFAQIAAQSLGIEIGDVLVFEGDTAFAPFGTGTGASRGAVSGGGAVLGASQKLAEKLKRLAADVMEASPADIVLRDGRAEIAGVPGNSVAVSELAKIAYCLHARMPPPGEEFGLDAVHIYDPPTASYSNATHIAAVAIDDSTGAIEVEDYVVVHDCGRIINPMIVDGQIHGGVSHGIASVLMEGFCYDADGQVITGSLMDYAVPTAASFPNFRSAHFESPSTTTAGGFKGTGESGTVGSVPALTAAIEDALQSFNLTITALPVTPAALFDLMRRASPPRGQ